MSNRIIINADDYAISPGVSRSIRSLIENERVSATSCMTGSEFWNEDGNALRKIMAPKFSAGLHITLTDQRACLKSETLAPAGKLPSLGGLWRGILAGRIQRRDLELEIYAQIELFKDIMWRAPDHIDGHHHIQHLPIVRDIILELWASERVKRNAWLRVTNDSLLRIALRRTAIMKTIGISFTGFGLRHRAKQLGIPVNDGFAGIYDLAPGSDFEAVCRKSLSTLSPKMIFMCHPGHPDDALALKDTVTTQREIEHRYLQSPEFAAELDGCKGELAHCFDP
jgi:chitin disaccharide deacetylase